MLNICERRLAWLADKLGSIAIEALDKLELLDPSMTKTSAFRNCHEQEAARLRALIAIVSAPASKARLLEQAEEQELLARELEDQKIAATFMFPW